MPETSEITPSEISPPIAPDINVAPQPPAKPSRSKFIYFIFLIFILILVSFAAYWWGTKNSKTTLPLPIQITPSLESVTPTTSISPTGITWNSVPKQIASLSLFKPASTDSDNFFDPENVKFFEVGVMPNDIKIINAYIPVNGPGGEQFLRILRTNSNQLTVLFDPQDTWINESLTKELDPGIKTSTVIIPELTPPETLMENGLAYTRSYYSGTQYDDSKSPAKITATPYGDLYRINHNLDDSPAFVARQIILRLKDNTIVPYTLKTNLSADDKTPQIIWSDASYQGNDFTPNFVSGGCGSSLLATVPVVKNNSDISGKTEVGKTATGQTVYKITDPNNAITQSVYAVYKKGLFGEEAGISLETLAAEPNHYLWQDQLGDWQVFINQKYIPAVECGKPVIYLYPPATTSVTVKVGANIRLSDPLYPPQGWQVLAHPNGQLDYHGKTYSSLFWEGLGNGPYPDYHQSGIVVAQSALLPTLKSQLRELGLNSAESQDFLNFWLPKFPGTPYIRLTWLGTADLERLAPLTITPAPDTMIRIFLEFEGLNQPVTLQPQKLSAPARSGFTLVEWGGLLTKSR